MHAVTRTMRWLVHAGRMLAELSCGGSLSMFVLRHVWLA